MHITRTFIKTSIQRVPFYGDLKAPDDILRAAHEWGAKKGLIFYEDHGYFKIGGTQEQLDELDALLKPLVATYVAAQKEAKAKKLAAAEALEAAKKEGKDRQAIGRLVIEARKIARAADALAWVPYADVAK